MTRGPRPYWLAAVALAGLAFGWGLAHRRPAETAQSTLAMRALMQANAVAPQVEELEGAVLHLRDRHGAVVLRMSLDELLASELALKRAKRPEHE